MDTFGQQLSDARDAKAEALAKLALLDNGELVLAKGATENHARELLRLSIAEYDAVISQLGWRDKS
jgi:hypothetical protein